jgi:hypothetical protein
MRQYLNTQRERFSSDAELAQARVSDPEVWRVIESFMF